jgi:hypothetical protein
MVTVGPRRRPAAMESMTHMELRRVSGLDSQADSNCAHRIATTGPPTFLCRASTSARPCREQFDASFHSTNAKGGRRPLARQTTADPSGASVSLSSTTLAMHIIQSLIKPKERQRIWIEHKQSIIRVVGVLAVCILFLIVVASRSAPAAPVVDADDESGIVVHSELFLAPSDGSHVTSTQRLDRAEADAENEANKAEQKKLEGFFSKADDVITKEGMDLAPNKIDTPEVRAPGQPLPSQPESDTLDIPALSKEEQSLLEEAEERGGPPVVPLTPLPSRPDDATDDSPNGGSTGLRAATQRDGDFGGLEERCCSCGRHGIGATEPVRFVHECVHACIRHHPDSCHQCSRR